MVGSNFNCTIDVTWSIKLVRRELDKASTVIMLNILRRRFLGGSSPKKSFKDTSRPWTHGIRSCEMLHKKRGAVSCHDLCGHMVEEYHRSMHNSNTKLRGSSRWTIPWWKISEWPEIRKILFHGNSQLVISNSNLTNNLLVPVRSPGNKANTAVGSDKLINPSKRRDLPSGGICSGKNWNIPGEWSNDQNLERCSWLLKIELLNASSFKLGMSSYQEGQLLCGHPRPNRRDSGELELELELALSKVLTNYPVRTASEGHAVQGHRPSTVDNFLFIVVVVCSLSLMSAILSWKLSISEKHRTVQLCTEAPKNDTLEHRWERPSAT